MMYRIVSAALLTAALALGGASAASAASTPTAQPVRAVQLSGRTFHVRACGDAVSPGKTLCHAHIVTDSRGAPLIQNAGSGTPRGYGPADLRSAYNVTGTGSQGMVIAIVDAYGYSGAEADLAVYRAQYGLPACTTANGCFAKYNQRGVKGSYPTDDAGWSDETALDLDMASAMCPNCRIVLVEADTASLPDLAASVNRAVALGAHVVSNSYGGGEIGTPPFEAAYNHPGVAITASAGDSGYGPQFPASSPHVTAVGGTSLVRSATARGWSETVWGYPNGQGSGSGCSGVYLKPTWQTDPLCRRRMIADVSAVADPQTGVAVYGPAGNGKAAWLVFGGTSVSAPLVAGIYAVNGGAANYGADPYNHVGALNDVTSGSNGNCGGTYFCTAGPGYDGPTGLGTPNGTTAF
jgi:subtilase family serine protease